MIHHDGGKKRIYERSCNMKNCNNLTNKLTRVPSIVKDRTFNKNAKESTIKNYYRRKFLRKEWLIRIGLPNDQRKSLRICRSHQLQQVKEYRIPWKDLKGIQKYQYCEIIVPLKFDETPSTTKSDMKKRKIITIEEKDYDNYKRTNHRKSKNLLNLPKRNQRCCFAKCEVKASALNNSIKFKRVPPPVPVGRLNSTAPLHINTHNRCYAIKKFNRNEYLRRIGSNINDSRKDLRICNQHPLEEITRSIEWMDHKDVKQYTSVKFIVPTTVGMSSVLNESQETLRDQKGVGLVRMNRNYINNAKNVAQQPNREDLSWGLALAEQLQVDEDLATLNNTIDINEMSRRPSYIEKRINNNQEKKKERTNIKLGELEDEHIKNDTGFRSKLILICYIIVVCDGNIEVMCNTITKMTWLEEWYFVFERIWARATVRYYDSKRLFKKSPYLLRKVYDEKIRLIMKARKLWPTYATIQEDEKLRNDRWNKYYSNQRVVMWDNTNIKLHKPSNAEAQRNTFSSYYNDNVGKGAVFIQLCGWMGTYELWMGGVSDSEYMIRSGILKQQQLFVKDYDPDNKDIPFLNILDRGYRIISAAWRTGGQFVLQPAFAKSDKKFNTLEVIRSASVASDRGGNERAVRIAKMCGSLKNGLQGNGSPERLCDLWLAWSFQANFMFKKVL